MIGQQNDGKGLFARIDLKCKVVAPLRGDGVMPYFDIFENTSESLPVSIKDPGAVARFQYGGFHATKLTDHPGVALGDGWQPPEDLSTGPPGPLRPN